MILLLYVVCACENSQRTQAHALLERIAAVDLHAPWAAREAQVAQLRTLALRDAALVAVRDRCTRVHAGLLAAERAQAGVRQRLAQAGQGKLADTELAAIAAALAQAGQQLKAAQGELPACERSTRELALGAR